jgi:integrase
MKDLKALWNWGYLNDLVDNNPLKAIRPWPEEPKIKYVPPPEDIDAVLMAANPEETDMLTVLYHTGGRIGEIRRLTWEDVNFERREITLWTRKRRGGELQPDKLAVGGSLQQLLGRRWKNRNKQSVYVFCHEDGTQLARDGKLRHLMEDLCTKAQVKPFGFHAIRHHVASIIADSGKATLGQVQKFLRHKRPTTTERYLHEVTRDQREVAEILEKGKKHESLRTKIQG